jgi:hypothetical protein
MFDVNGFEISAPLNPTHYSSARNGDVLDNVVHRNVTLSDVIVCDILDSEHLPIVTVQVFGDDSNKPKFD